MAILGGVDACEYRAVYQWGKEKRGARRSRPAAAAEGTAWPGQTLRPEIVRTADSTWEQNSAYRLALPQLSMQTADVAGGLARVLNGRLWADRDLCGTAGGGLPLLELPPRTKAPTTYES
jgi:hypothetical protein